jgi:hypothetical protein
MDLSSKDLYSKRTKDTRHPEITARTRVRFGSVQRLLHSKRVRKKLIGLVRGNSRNMRVSTVNDNRSVNLLHRRGRRALQWRRCLIVSSRDLLLVLVDVQTKTVATLAKTQSSV